MRSSPLAILFVLGCCPWALAQPYESLGVRALGMGGAFVAVADDATAAYWNPAGLPTGQFFSLLGDFTASKRRQPASGLDTPASDGHGTIVALSTNEIAFSYYRVHTSQVARSRPSGAPTSDPADVPRGAVTLRSLDTHNVAITGARFIYPGVSLGTSVRFVYGSAGMAGGHPGLSLGDLLAAADDVSRRGQGKVDLDVGLMIGSERFRVGVAARNLLQPRFETPDGESLRLDRQVRAGVAWHAWAGLLVAVDADLTRARLESGDGSRRNVALGAEYWLGPSVGVRGGARVNVEADDPRAVGAFGISLGLMAGVYLDGQITRSRDAIERGWSVATRVGF